MNQPTAAEAALELTNPSSPLNQTVTALRSPGAALLSSPLVGQLLPKLIPVTGLPGMIGIFTGATPAPALLVTVAKAVNLLSSSTESLDILEEGMYASVEKLGVPKVQFAKALLSAAALLGINVDPSQPAWMGDLLTQLSARIVQANEDHVHEDVNCPACGLNLNEYL